MAKKKNMQNSLFEWAYTNRKMGSKTADILKSVGEVNKLLDSVGKKKKYRYRTVTKKQYGESSKNYHREAYSA